MIKFFCKILPVLAPLKGSENRVTMSRVQSSKSPLYILKSVPIWHQKTLQFSFPFSHYFTVHWSSTKARNWYTRCLLHYPLWIAETHITRTQLWVDKRKINFAMELLPQLCTCNSNTQHTDTASRSLPSGLCVANWCYFPCNFCQYQTHRNI